MGSSLAIQCVCLVFLLVFITKVRAQNTTFDVTKYGAVADGKTDCSKALSDAWDEACQANGGGTVLFPTGIYLVGPVVLKGLCKGPSGLKIQGTLKAPAQVDSSVDNDHWITFQYVDQLVIDGGGSLDGQGPSAWPYNDCKNNSQCKKLPASLRFDFVNNSNIKHITSMNSKNVHINLFGSHGITLSNINISAPGDSPNTDGIHIGGSSDIRILDSVISTGDDCISFSSGSNNINVNGVHCGPGHGISIGSLGKSAGDDVSALDIRNCTFKGTQNGVRIKTWSPSLSGTVSRLNFQNIQMDNVTNPIIIDQQYCPSAACNATDSSQVHIKDVKFNNIWGSSSSEVAVLLKCSKTTPCEEIELSDINLTYGKGSATSSCSHVKGKAYGVQKPSACI